MKRDGVPLGILKIGALGKHNLQNALGAAVVAVQCGLSTEVAMRALGTYPGVGRRLEKVGEYGGVTLLDDFAHHPKEMSASFEAVRKACGRGKIIVVFQPHRYSRTRLLRNELGRALLGADCVFVTEIYTGPGETAEAGVGSRLVVDAALENGHPGVKLVEDKTEAMFEAVKLAREGDVIITMGAGDIWKTHGDAVKALLSRD